MNRKLNLKKFVIYTILFAVIGAVVINLLGLTGIAEWIVIFIVAILSNVMARR